MGAHKNFGKLIGFLAPGHGFPYFLALPSKNRQGGSWEKQKTGGHSL